MWNNTYFHHHSQSLPNNKEIKKDGLVAVAIDKDKGSQYALKWAVDNVLNKGQTVTLLHVKQKPHHQTHSTPAISHAVNEDVARSVRSYVESQVREIFLPFRCFCSRKDVKCNEVILEQMDISRALIDYCHQHAIEIMIVAASSRNQLVRKFRGPDVATNLTKGCPDFCTVYVISKGKMVSVRSASRPIAKPSAKGPTETHPFNNAHHPTNESPSMRNSGVGSTMRERERGPHSASRLAEDMDAIRSPFTRGRASNGKAYGEVGLPDCDISFVGSSPWHNNERASVDHRPSYDRGTFEVADFGYGSRISSGSDGDHGSFGSDRRSIDQSSLMEYSSSNCSGFSSVTINADDLESEMRRLRLELKQTMEMYNAACKEALAAKQKTSELQKTMEEEDHRMEEARLSEEAARTIAEQERAKYKAASEAAEAAQRLAELEAQKRIHAEIKAHKETEERKKALENFSHNENRYRRYSIGEIEAATNHFSESHQIGEGGYGPVYKCTLDHTTAAIKVLRPDAAQGQSQFQQEVEILSCIRHPNMVILLGACPEYGCLVYEYMSNGSLEDRLFCRGGTPPLSWQIRFRIATEIATGLLFLHQTKPEPLVHRDLKPANILLDRNFVSKISDVGLARLVPPSVADTVTQYRLTQAAGTFCYIDPEYQQTGMLGTKSDIYSLGILYLQLITAKPAMGLTHHVQRAIENGTFSEMLDPNVRDWPYEESLQFAKLSLRCAELRKKDRPDLHQVLPELNILTEFAEANMHNFLYSPLSSPYRPSQFSGNHFSQEANSENQSRYSNNSGISSGRSQTSSTSSF